MNLDILFTMSVEFPEIANLNNARTPFIFNKVGQWEIKERVPVLPSPNKHIDGIRTKLFQLAGINATPLPIPHQIPKADRKTKYEEMGGTARYVVEKDPNVGEGYTALVYRGWDRKLERFVAVKELREWDAKEYRDLIELEVKTLVRLEHPGIPKVYDFIESKTEKGKRRKFMIMELLTSENLLSRLSDTNRKPLPLHEIVRIVSQSANTVDYMNEKGLFHGDLKTDNIILASPHIKVIDFASSSWSERRTPTNKHYSAPERIRGKKDARTDEFSMAIIAFESLCNKVRPTNIGELKSEDFNFPQIPYDLSLDKRNKLVDIFQKGLARNPDDRYQTSGEFAVAFGDCFS